MQNNCLLYVLMYINLEKRKPMSIINELDSTCGISDGELYPGGMSMLEDKEVRLTVDVRNAGMKALQEVLGPVGMVKFMQQYDMGYGDYTKEKQEQPDMSLEEIDMLLKDV